MTILCTFRVTLFAGFIGSAGWSRQKLPTPYPLPFGFSVSALFRWLGITTIQTRLQAIALLMGTLLCGYWRIRLSAIPAFHPRFRRWWLVANLGEVLSPLHLRGRTFTYMVIQLSRFTNLAANPPSPYGLWFLANESHFATTFDPFKYNQFALHVFWILLLPDFYNTSCINL